MGASVVLGPTAGVAAGTEALLGAAGAGGLTLPAAMPSLVGSLTLAGSAGPFGLVLAAGAIMSGIVIVAGEPDKPQMNCWEQIIRIDEDDGPSMSAAVLERRRKHGMLLQDLDEHCDFFRGRFEDESEEKLVVKNRAGEIFGFVESLKVPAGTFDEGHNASHDITILHAVKLESK